MAKFVWDISASMFMHAVTGKWDTRDTATLAVFVGLLVLPATLVIKALIRA